MGVRKRMHRNRIRRALIATPTAGLDGIAAMLRLALDQLEQRAADADASSALSFLERASRDLSVLAREGYRAAS